MDLRRSCLARQNKRPTYERFEAVAFSFYFIRVNIQR